MTTTTRYAEQSFLSRLPSPDREALLALSVPMNARKGDLIFRAGSPGKNVYLLQEGSVKIYHLSPSGKEVLLWFCVPGELFGITELCRGNTREVYAQATSPARVVSVSRDAFQQFMAAHPQTALLVVEVLSCRVRGLSDLVQAMATSDVAERVIRLIGRLSANAAQRQPGKVTSVDIPITHQEIANMVGATRQSVTSVLNTLKRLGVVTCKNRRISVNGMLPQSLPRG